MTPAFSIFFKVLRPLLLNRPPLTIRNTRVRLLEIYSCLFMSEIKDILEKCNYSPPILYFYIYQKSIRKVRSLVFTLKISLKIHMVKLYYVFCILYNFHWLGISISYPVNKDLNFSKRVRELIPCEF